MDEKKLTILKMLEEGKITSHEAARLLEAIEDDMHKSLSPKSISLKIFDTDSEEPILKVKLPLSIAKTAYHLTPENVLDDIEEQGFYIREIFSDIDNMEATEVARLQTDTGKNIIIEVI